MSEEFSIGDLIKDAINGLGGMLHRDRTSMLTILRQPTPIKITVVAQANATGQIGGGLANPAPVDLWSCPMSHEAWINRVSITASGATPTTPLATGEIMCTGSTSNEPIFWLPQVGTTVAPWLALHEGRLSAPHLNPGEQILLVGDTLPPNTSLKFDLQIVLVSGVSSDTPRAKDHAVDIMP